MANLFGINKAIRYRAAGWTYDNLRRCGASPEIIAKIKEFEDGNKVATDSRARQYLSASNNRRENLKNQESEIRTSNG